MNTKKLSLIALALAVFFAAQIGVQAQEDTFVVTVPNLSYLETYNIPELQSDPLWHRVAYANERAEALHCVQQLAYLETYSIEGLQNDPMWQAGRAELAMVQARHGA